MTWRGEFRFGETWAAYRGPAAENALHAHAAFQVIVAHGPDVVVADGEGAETAGSALLIRPMVPHAVSSHPDVSIVYLEAQSPLALALLELVGPEEVTALPDSQARRFDLSGRSEEWPARIDAASSSSKGSLDPRLAQALGELSREPGATTIASAARRCGLSESRLRTLARQQLRVPLSTWLIWRKLERAAKALAAGGSLAAAALEGGFADQAHFTREMRRMFGITPGVAAAALM